MTKKEILEAIVKEFARMYGFAPAKKNIVFLESSSYMSASAEKFTWVAFSINGIGYCFEPYGALDRNESYDLQTK